MIPIYCEICETQFAQAEPSEPHQEWRGPSGLPMDLLKEPMKGSMFISHLHNNGAPPPFHPEADWEFMRCPFCGHRPFLHQDRVMISHGIFYVLGDPVRKPECEKTLSERNQDQINAMFPEETKSEKTLAERNQEQINAIFPEEEAPAPEEPDEKALACRYCNRPFKHKARLARHEVNCERNHQKKHQKKQ